ncbi:MAG: hypothetical protein HC921_20400 [Synechococcaceae cyanobacterium SM2_3_1]|nr:hypothetical protein [Synechococcaceae cyanobacterium SM2_3_1]
MSMDLSRRLFHLISSVGSSFLVLLIAPVAQAQLRLVPEASQQVYETLPALPRENQYQYIDPETGDPETNTLVRRMMLYHLQIKARALTNRFDWKLTLADYLEKNEAIFAQAYPGSQTLTKNPYTQDKVAVQSLTRQERAALLEAILIALGGDPTPPQLYIPPPSGSHPHPLLPPQRASHFRIQVARIY